jgi:Tol biopolymer transport system component/DNA-binding winged helix-turn-helix (wHTH) protein
MSSQPAADRSVRFGLFELDSARGELRKQGRKIRLQDQPFQVLELLLARPAEVVTREELQQALWPADTFVEFDQGLNTAIKKIRLALRDSADNPRFIDTITRKGYRFIAPVEPGSPSVIPPLPRRSHRMLWIAATIAIAVVGTLVTIALRAPVAEPLESVVPLTTYPGWESSPSFSPDGSQVAFIWNGTKNRVYHGIVDYDIYVKQVGEERALRIPHDRTGAVSPAWSTDGASIAFLRLLPPGADVYLIPALGGAERKLGHVSCLGVATFTNPKVSWTPDSKWIALSDRPSDEGECSVVLLSVETGEKRRLTFPPAKAGDSTPAVSPDGRWLAFTRQVPETSADIYLLALSVGLTPVGQPRRLTFEGRVSLSPAWTRDSREIIFESGPMHLPQLWRVSVSGREKPRRLRYAEPLAMEPSISRGKPRLAFTKATWDVNIWRMAIPASPGRPRVTHCVCSFDLPGARAALFCGREAGRIYLEPLRISASLDRLSGWIGSL